MLGCPWIEISASFEVRRGQEFLDIIRLLATEEALCIGRHVGLLGPAAHGIGDMPSHAALEHVFLAQRWHANSGRDLGAIFDHSMIEERESPLDGMCHRHAITLGAQQVAGEQGLDLDVLGARERVQAGRRARNQGIEFVAMVVVRKCCFDGIG